MYRLSAFLFLALAGNAAAQVGAPRFSPPAVSPGASSVVLITAFVPNAPGAVSVEAVDGGFTASLLDDGAGADAAPGDAVFSARLTLPTRGHGPSDCVLFRVRSGRETSPTASLCITNFPVDPSPVDAANIVGQYAGDELLVAYQAGMSEGNQRALAVRSGAEIVGAIPALGLVQWRFRTPARTEVDVEARARAALQLPGILQAIPNVMTDLHSITPNDPDYSQQYGMRLIRANEAWVTGRGGPLVAVVDTGLELTHPEFVDRIQSGGKDYASGHLNAQDDHGHGTHVSGIIGARTNNSVGVAGVTWSSKILPMRVYKMVVGKKKPVGSMSMVAAAITDSVAAGARVINASLGGYGDGAKNAVCPAVAQAVAAGVVVVVSSGNDGTSKPSYPAACPGALAVAAVDASNNLTGFSNTGDHVALTAPGFAIRSTTAYPNNSLADCPMCTPGGYISVSGTSMAAPHVSGVVALLLERFPNWTPAQVEKRLRETARPR